MPIHTRAHQVRIFLATLITTLTVSAAAVAATVNVTGTANYAGPPNLVADMFGTGPVSFDLRFDISPDTPLEATLSNASGTLSWAAPDARQFEVDTVVVVGASVQSIVLEFTGTGPGLPDIDVLDIRLGFDLGVDVLTTDAQLSALITGDTVNYFLASVRSSTGTVQGASFGAFDGGGVTGTVDDVDVPIAPVPLPAGLPMMILGIGLLAAVRRPSARSRTRSQSTMTC